MVPTLLAGNVPLPAQVQNGVSKPCSLSTPIAHPDLGTATGAKDDTRAFHELRMAESVVSGTPPPMQKEVWVETGMPDGPAYV